MIYCFDIGTSNIKGGAFTAKGELEGRVEAPLPKIRSKEYGLSLDTRAFRTLFFKLSKELTANSGPATAVVIDANGPSFIFLNNNNRPLIDGVLWFDRRAEAEANDIARLAGYRPSPSLPLPLLLWLKRNSPENYQKSSHILSFDGYINALLTGNRYNTLPGRGYELWLCDRATAETVGVNPDKLPPLCKPGFQVGNVRSEASEESGLSCGTPVFAAGADFTLSLLGSATVHPQEASLRSGSSEGVNICCNREVTGKTGLFVYGHVIEPYTNVSGVVPVSGKGIEWLQREFNLPSHFKELEALIASSPPGANGVVATPHFQGVATPSRLPHATATFTGLTLLTSRADMLRAYIESIYFAVRDILESAKKQGVSVEKLKICGTSGGSAFLNRIRANILKVPIEKAKSVDTELLGGAVIALTALGKFSSLQQAAEELYQSECLYEPESDLSLLYDEKYHTYQQLSKKLYS